MNNYKLLISVFSISLLMHNISNAEEYIDSAQVLSTKPVVERLYAPSKNCRHSAYSRHRYQENNSDAGGAIMGALLGGIAGAQVGDGSGQDAAAALGAMMGAHIGSGGGDITGEQLLGALAGGVVGNQVGGGSGKTASTALGAVLGAALADGQISRDRHTIARECGNNVVSKKVITKYKVNYLYNGIELTGELPYKPEDSIDVIVKVDVLEDITLQNYPRSN